MNDLKITEYKNIRVLTTQQIAEAYGTDSKVISNNFNRNRERYVEGKVSLFTTANISARRRVESRKIRTFVVLHG